MPLTPEIWRQDFQVNTNPNGTQNDAVITQLASGYILVAWTDFDNSTSPGAPAGSDIIGRIFDPLGNAVTAEFRLNSSFNVTSEQSPSITALADGGFMVVYDRVGGDFNDLIYDTWSFNSATETVAHLNDGFLFAANAQNTNDAFDPLVVSASATSTMTAYRQENPDGLEEIFVRAYNPSTDTFGTLVRLNELGGVTPEGDGGISLAAISNGTYVIAYVDHDASLIDTFGFHIVGPDGLIHWWDDIAAATDIIDPTIVGLNGGGFVAVWGANNDIFFRIMENDGDFLTSVARTGLATDANNQNEGAVAALADGGFVIVWDDDTLGQIRGQRYDPTGDTIGSEFLVDDTGAGGMQRIEIEAFADGRFSVTWDDGLNVRVKIFDVRDDPNDPGVHAPDEWQIGTVGHDTFTTDSISEVIHGWSGNDIITDSGGTAIGFARKFFGDAGNDRINVETGIDHDLYDGGAGIDTIDWSGFNQVEGIRFDLAAGTASFFSDSEVMVDFENLNGTNNADTIVGTSGRNILNGNGGGDIIEGGSASDTLGGDSGNDRIFGMTEVNPGGEAFSNTLSGGSGNDELTGSAGHDILRGDGEDDTLRGGLGNDLMEGGFNHDTLFGGDGDDILFSMTQATPDGSAAGDLLDGGAGNDQLRGGNGSDTLIGGLGADVMDGAGSTDTADYSASSAGVTVDLSTGVGQFGDAEGDMLTRIERLVGSNHNDMLTGDSAANVLRGLDGFLDRLFGGAGDDSLFGGSGLDRLEGGAGADLLDGGVGTGDEADYGGSLAGVTIDLATSTFQGGDADGDILVSIESISGSDFDDSLTGDDGGNSFFSEEGNDFLDGGGGDDVLYGGDGLDEIYGGLGDDSLDGGDGDDLIDGGAGGDEIDGEGGDDHIFGGDGIDRLFGDPGDDNLDGGAGTDELSGDSGNDTLTGGLDSDTLNGGADIDTVDLSTSASRVNVNLNTGAGLGGDAHGDIYANIENIIGTDNARADFLTGNGAANVIAGLAGGDQIDGLGGVDTVDLSASASRVNVNLNTGAGLGGDAHGDTYANIENIIGTNDARTDFLTGNAGANLIQSLDGDDVLAGLAGADALLGGFGSDTVDLSTSASRVNVNLNTGAGLGGDAHGDTYANIENIIGTNNTRTDFLTGNGVANVIAGLAGGDQIDGLGGVDTVDLSASASRVNVDLNTGAGLGGDAHGDTYADIENIIGTNDDRTDFLTGDGGDNRIVGLAGGDQIDGMGGIDTADYSASGSRINVNLTTGTGLGGDAHDDVLANIENIIGTNDDRTDFLTGDGGDNRIEGLAGGDRIDGRGGNDALFGGADGDTFSFIDDFGSDTIGDFEDDLDHILFQGAGALTDSTDIGGNAVYTFDTGAQLTVTGVTVALLADDITFV